MAKDVTDPEPLWLGTVFARTEATAMRRRADFHRERAAAPALVARLDAVPPRRRGALVRRQRRFHTRAVAERLLAEGRRLGFEEPRRAAERVELALAVAGLLDAEHYGAEALRGLRARCWAWLANVRRLAADLRGAAEAMAQAEAELEPGTGDPLVQAQVLELAASLRKDERRLEEAARMLDEAARIYRGAEELHHAGRALLNRANVARQLDRPREAVALLATALEWIDAEAEPRLELVGRHNLAVYLIDDGRLEEAASLVRESRPLYEEVADAWSLLRLRWLEGYLALEQGRWDEARSCLEEARASYRERGASYEQALVDLDLASLHARLGRPRELRRVALEALEIFRRHHIRREAMTALLLFRRAVEAEEVTLAMIRDLATHLHNAHGNA